MGNETIAALGNNRQIDAHTAKVPELPVTDIDI